MDIKKRDFLIAAGAGGLPSAALAQGSPVSSNRQPSTVAFNFRARGINKASRIDADRTSQHHIGSRY